MSQAPLSSARAFFDELAAKGEADAFAYLSSIPSTFNTDPFFETEWLDFKENPHTEDKRKEIWSKALSGFANVTDGIIVWGISASKAGPGPDKIDAAHSLSLIPNALGFASRLRELHRNATNPPVMGVNYQTYTNQRTGTGFVVCLIPQSRYKPHRAEWANKDYYIRVGDSFVVAEPGILRILFYPDLHPYLQIEATLGYRIQPYESGAPYRTVPNIAETFNKAVNAQSMVYLDARLRNVGAVTAKDVYIVVYFDREISFATPPRDWNVDPHPLGRGACRANRPFHPGELVPVFSSTTQVAFPNKQSIHDPWLVVPYFTTLSAEFHVFAEGAQPQILTVEFTPDDFVSDVLGPSPYDGYTMKPCTIRVT